MNLSPTPKRLCHLLILTTDLKFDHELNSNIYMVKNSIGLRRHFFILKFKAANVLMVSKIQYWMNLDFANDYL